MKKLILTLMLSAAVLSPSLLISHPVHAEGGDGGDGGGDEVGGQGTVTCDRFNVLFALIGIEHDQRSKKPLRYLKVSRLFD